MVEQFLRGVHITPQVAGAGMRLRITSTTFLGAMIALIVVGISTASWPTSSHAGVLFEGPELQVNTYTTSDQYGSSRRSVARGADGSFVVVWDSYGSSGSDTDGFSVQARRYDAAGIPAGPEFQINAYTTSNQFAAAVAASADGAFVVVWTSYGSAGGDSAGYSIQARRYDSAGAPAGTEFQVNAFTTGDQFPAKVSSSDDGRFVVVWTSDGFPSDPSDFRIQARRYTAVGLPDGAEFQVNTFDTGSQSNPDVTMMAADASFVIAWTSDGSAGTDPNFSIQAQRYDTGGSPVGTQFQVNTFTTSIQISPAVASGADGRFVIVWTSSDSSGTDNTDAILGQRFDGGGSPDGTEFQVNVFTTGYQIDPAVASLSDGGFAVVWTSSESAATDTSGSSVQARRYDAAGVPDGPEIQVNSYTTDGQGYAVSVASGGRSDFVVSWNSYYQDGDGYGVVAQRVCNDANSNDICDRDEPVTTTTVPSGGACGNGIVEEGEECDDAGTNGSGGGCSISCTLSGSCPATPLVGCIEFSSGKASMKMKRKRSESAPFDNAKDQLQLKFRSATSVVDGASVGDPEQSGTAYSYCVYDAEGLVVGADIGPGSEWSCRLDRPGREQCKYKDRIGSNAGLLSAKVKAGDVGKGQAQIKMKSRVAAFTAPRMPLVMPVTAQIKSSAGLCLSADFLSADKNDAEKGSFKAKN